MLIGERIELADPMLPQISARPRTRLSKSCRVKNGDLESVPSMLWLCWRITAETLWTVSTS